MFEEEYTIPEEIKAMFTDEFCKAFRKALCRIQDGEGLDTTAEFGFFQRASTGGHVVAFWTACMETHNEALFDYWESLPWYESDVFDDGLLWYMTEKGYILGYMEDIIAEKLHIPKEELEFCPYCCHYFTKDMGELVYDKDLDEFDWRCYNCAKGEEDTYYTDQYDKMQAWRKKRYESKA